MLTFLSDPDEKALPFSERTRFWVCDGPKRIATLSLSAVDDDTTSALNQATAMWSVKMHHGTFDPFSHHHEAHEGEPYVQAEEDGYTELVHPKNMTLKDARKWVKDNYVGK